QLDDAYPSPAGTRKSKAASRGEARRWRSSDQSFLCLWHIPRASKDLFLAADRFLVCSHVESSTGCPTPTNAPPPRTSRRRAAHKFDWPTQAWDVRQQTA